MQTNNNEILIEAAQPQLYRVNAFRIMELPVDANARDLASRSQMIEMAANIGLPVPHGSGYALPLSPAPDSNDRREAMQRLRDPERRLIDEFFWFWPHKLGESENDKALLALAEGDELAACNIWCAQEREQSEANISVHNLAVFYHASALDLEYLSLNGGGPLSPQQIQQRDACWLQTFRRWKILLEYENFWTRLTARIRALGDLRLTTGVTRRMRDSLPLALLLINAKLALQMAERKDEAAAQRHLQLMNESGFDQTVIAEALRLTVNPTREMIKSLCSIAQPKAESDPEHADQIVRQLHQQTWPSLAILDTLLPKDNQIRVSLHDDVAQQMLMSTITFCNKSKDWDTAFVLFDLALSVAAGQTVRTRLEDNIKTIKRNIELDRCWFCQSRKADPSASVDIKMHGEVTRTPTYEYSKTVIKINWKYKTIQVPRCSTCKQIHEQQTIILGGGFFFGLMAGFVGFVAYLISNPDHFLGGLLIIITGMVIGVRIDKSRAKSHLKNITGGKIQENVHPESYKNEYPEIKELLSKGWQYGEKPQGVQ
jgi:hypothetical protein